MKKIICLIINIVLVLSFCMTSNAAGTATLNGNTSVTVGSNIEFTVNVSGCSDVSSIAVAVTMGDGFEIVSGTWLKSGGLKTFDTSKLKGSLGLLETPDVNGNLFKLVLKANTASANAKSVSVNVIAKNGSNEIMNVTASKSVRIYCATHSYGSYIQKDNSNHVRTCSDCGNVETKAHTWNAGTVTESANCKKTGNMKYTCTVCNATKNETIPTTNNHTYGSWSQIKKATCTDKGEEKRICSTCSKAETRDINATGHKMGSWSQSKAPSCKATGTEQRKCTISGCTHTETRNVAATGHSLGNWKTTKEATCTEKGEQTRSCSKCNHEETKAIAALGHKFTNPTITKQPTCTESGIESGKCTRCNKETTNTIKATGHKIENYTVTLEPTCTVEGKKEGVCVSCGIKAAETVAAKGHSYGETVVTKEATELEEGIKTQTCTICGEVKEETIPVITIQPETIPDDTVKDEKSEVDEKITEDKDNILGNVLAVVGLVLVAGIVVMVILVKKKEKK